MRFMKRSFHFLASFRDDTIDCLQYMVFVFVASASSEGSDEPPHILYAQARKCLRFSHTQSVVMKKG